MGRNAGVIVNALAAVTLPRPEPIACTAVLQMLCPTDADGPLGVSGAADDDGFAEAGTSRGWRSGAPRISMGRKIESSERSG